MLSSWIVIVVAFGLYRLLFAIASYGDRPGRGPRGRAGVLIYPLSLAIYCTSWTFFARSALRRGPGQSFWRSISARSSWSGCARRSCCASSRLAKAQKITSIAFHRGALWQEPADRGDGRAHRDHRLGALYRAAAQGRRDLARDGARQRQQRRLCARVGDIALIVTTAMALFASHRHPPHRRHRASARADAGDCVGIDRQLVAFSGGRRCVTFVVFGRTSCWSARCRARRPRTSSTIHRRSVTSRS